MGTSSALARHVTDLTTGSPVIIQFRYDSTVKLWRVTFRPRGDSIALPRVMHSAMQTS